MTRALALLAGLAGCFSPSAPTGAACAPLTADVRCPSGLECIAHDGVETCESPSGVGPDGGTDGGDLDTDGDGVRDATDNCPGVANANQANEDGDALGDVCDPCPPSDDNTDTDGDGVGDVCDPNPTVTGDKLVLFDGFKGSLTPTWTTTGVATTMAGDASLLADDTVSTIISVPSPSAAHVELRTSLVIDAITATGQNLGSINVIDRMQPNTDKSVACQLSGLVNGTQEELRIFDANAALIINNAPHAFANGTQTELRLRRAGTNYACRVTGPSLELVGTSTFSPASPRIGLRVRGAAARFRWVMIITSP